MRNVRLDITLTLRGPVLIHASVPGHLGVDAHFETDDRGRPYLPGTLVKGKLREAWAELHGLDPEFAKDAVDLLGDKSGNRKDRDREVTPARGRLLFSDFVHCSPPRRQQRYRIEMDPDLGSAKKGFFQVIESPFLSGELPGFHGSVEFSAVDEAEAGRICREIAIGLRWLTSIGAYGSIGFGELVNAAVSEQYPPARSTVSPSGFSEGFDLVIRPLQPFCIARPRVKGNLFVSEETIPGNAIKGCVAQMWNDLRRKTGAASDGIDPDRPALSKHFNAIRFRAAFPAQSCQVERPVQFPLSLARSEDKSYDLALLDNPVAFKTGQGLRAPAFAMDWKDEEEIRSEFGWRRPDRKVRVRTAHNPATRRAADEQLFTYEMILPGGCAWHSRVDLDPEAIHDAKDREAALNQLAELLAGGLRWLGKTKAAADIEIRPHHALGSAVGHRSAVDPGAPLWIITLQTPAILSDPRMIRPPGRRSALHKAYSEAFADLSSRTLVLQRFFATQSLVGGYYLRRRFQMNTGEAPPGADATYEPYLVTDPGSVFVLTADPTARTDAEAVIRGWQTTGLPLPGWARQRYSRNGRDGDHWENCPFIPQNGYGEIAVNLTTHWDRRPKAEEVHELQYVQDALAD